MIPNAVIKCESSHNNTHTHKLVQSKTHKYTDEISNEETNKLPDNS